MSEIERAIASKNLGRLSEIGVQVVALARLDHAWFEVLSVIAGYLRRSPAHIWQAIDLLKQAALMAPDKSKKQQSLLFELMGTIGELEEPLERVKASYTAVVLAPPHSVVMAVCLTEMLDALERVTSSEERLRYACAVLRYGDQLPALSARAKALVTSVQNNPKKPPQIDTDQEDSRLLGDFLKRHKGKAEG